MEILNNIEWYFDEPGNAIDRGTRKKISKKALKTVVFDDSVQENVAFCMPLNNDLTFMETRELSRPINVEQILTMLRDFYNEPLKEENVDNAFENNEEWKEEILDQMDGDMGKLTNYHVFEDTCTPDFCGIHLMEDGSYFVEIGPE